MTNSQRVALSATDRRPLSGGRNLRFYTTEECDAWLSGRQRKKPEASGGVATERVFYPSEPYRIAFLARWIATSITYQMPVLLWITEWGIWPSSENWHLYYRFRQSYGDQRLLDEAPGHLFLEHETEDLASFLQLAVLNGWGGYVLTHADYVNAFFSHDEFIDFFAGLDSNLKEIRETLRPSKSAAG